MAKPRADAVKKGFFAPAREGGAIKVVKVVQIFGGLQIYVQSTSHKHDFVGSQRFIQRFFIVDINFAGEKTVAIPNDQNLKVGSLRVFSRF